MLVEQILYEYIEDKHQILSVIYQIIEWMCVHPVK